MKRPIILASAIVALACSTTAFAQGKSQQKGKKDNTPSPPSRNELAAPAVVAPSPTGATPLAWIDDASLLAPGMVSLSISAMRWSGAGDAGISEVDVPIVDAAFGLAPRVQLSASVPRVVDGTDVGGAAGGVGTSFFSAKIGLYDRPGRSVKIAAAPTLQLLGKGVVASLGPSEGRVRWGLPISAEIGRGAARLYGGGGYFSPGLWFAGAAVGARASEKVSVSVGFSRAWRTADAETPDAPLSDRDRKEISGGVAYSLTPSLSAFGSIGRTIATLESNGAGTTVSGGIALSFVTATRPQP